MRIEQAISFFLVVGLLATPSSSPASERWNVLHDQAVSAAQHGRFEEADALLRSALKTLPTEENVAALILWNVIGSVHQRSGKIVEAEKDFKHVLEINARLPQPDSSEIAVALNDLATIAGTKHDTVRAEELLHEASRELAKVNETAGPTAALIKGNLALTLLQEGRYSEAGPLYEQAFTAVKALFGERSMEYARTLTNLALFQFQTGAYHKAVENGELARSIEDGLPFVTNAERALTLTNLGMALTEIGSLTQAEAVLLEAIQLEQDIPDGKAQLVVSLDRLAAVEQKSGHLAAAKDKELQVLALKRQGVPVDDLTLAAALNTLARIATTEHNFGEARQRYALACELLEKANGPLRIQYAATLSNMGALETAERHYKKAEALYRKALAIDESQLGANHPAVASDNSNIAAQLFYQKRTDEALELYDKAATLMEASFGPVSLEMAQLWRNIAIVCVVSQRFDQAASAYGKAIDALDRFSAGKNPALPSWLREYAIVLRKQQRWGEAEAEETRALGIEVRNALASQKRATPGAAIQDKGEKTSLRPGR